MFRHFMSIIIMKTERYLLLFLPMVHLQWLQSELWKIWTLRTSL